MWSQKHGWISEKLERVASSSPADPKLWLSARDTDTGIPKRNKNEHSDLHALAESSSMHTFKEVTNPNNHSIQPKAPKVPCYREENPHDA